MARKLVIAAALLAALGAVAPTDSIAKGGRGDGRGDGHGDGRGEMHCPPGLAKKHPHCIPPGQARKAWRVGDRFPDGYYPIRDPWRYHLPELGRNQSYYRMGDTYFRVDRNSREILQLIEAVGAVLN